MRAVCLPGSRGSPAFFCAWRHAPIPRVQYSAMAGGWAKTSWQCTEACRRRWRGEGGGGARAALDRAGPGGFRSGGEIASSAGSPQGSMAGTVPTSRYRPGPPPPCAPFLAGRGRRALRRTARAFLRQCACAAAACQGLWPAWSVGGLGSRAAPSATHGRCARSMLADAASLACSAQSACQAISQFGRPGRDAAGTRHCARTPSSARAAILPQNPEAWARMA